MAFIWMRGVVKVIVVNPVQIDYKKLAEVAKRSRGKINRIYLHWTAGHYDDVYDDYHINTKKIYHSQKFFKYFFAAGKFSGLKIRLCG